MPHRRGLLPSRVGTLRGRVPGSRRAGWASRQSVHPSGPTSPKNENSVKEPDELLKTSHLKNDTMPDADEFIIPKDLISVEGRFRSFSRYLAESWIVTLISGPSTEIHPLIFPLKSGQKWGIWRAFSTLVTAANLASGELIPGFRLSLASTAPKGDTSNRISRGTFLSGLDTNFPRPLNLVRQRCYPRGASFARRPRLWRANTRIPNAEPRIPCL